MGEDESELEEIRKRRLEQLKQQQAGQAEEQKAQEAAVEAQRQAILRQVLTEEARERLGRLKVAYPDFCRKVEDQLLYLAQSGRIDADHPIDDPTLKQVLERLSPDSRDINIKRL